MNALAHRRTTPLMIVAETRGNLPRHLKTRLYAVLLRGGARLDDHVLEEIKIKCDTWSPYLNKVCYAGGWKRYARAHRTRLVATFAPKLRLPADVIPLVVNFWANVGMY